MNADQPTAMIVLASEQLWPNIHGLVHWGEHLTHLYVYHTDDPHRSIEPARRLEALARALRPELTVHLPPRGLPMEPAAIHAQVRAWQAKLSGQRWLLNATGGTKLMTAGLLCSVGAPDCRVVYRELTTGNWFELHPATDGPGVRIEPIQVPADATDRIPVAELVKASWQKNKRDVNFAPPPCPLPVLELTRAWIASRGDWRAAFDHCGVLRERSSGFLFEQFIAAVLLELGVTNLVASVKHRGHEKETDLQEVDLVANYRGKLRIVDCKLASPEAGYRDRAVERITIQIRQAATTRRELGGQGAGLLLLRPNDMLSEDARDLAKEFGLTVLDQDDCRSLFTGLHRFLEVPGELPETLRRAEAELADAAERRWTNPMRPLRGGVRAAAGVSDQRAVIDLDAWMEAYGQSWFATRLGNVVDFQCDRPEDLRSERDWQRLLKQRFAHLGELSPLIVSRSGNTGRFRLRLKAGKFAALVADLEPCVGGPLFPSVARPARR